MLQIAVLDEQKNEATEVETVEKIEDEANSSKTNTSAKIADDKPDINDIPVEESQVFILCFAKDNYITEAELQLLTSHFTVA